MISESGLSNYAIEQLSQLNDDSHNTSYNLRVNVVQDDEFKSDTSHIRREAEQKLIGALTSYHHRRAESNKIKLKR